MFPAHFATRTTGVAESNSYYVPQSIPQLRLRRKRCHPSCRLCQLVPLASARSDQLWFFSWHALTIACAKCCSCPSGVGNCDVGVSTLFAICVISRKLQRCLGVPVDALHLCVAN